MGLLLKIEVVVHRFARITFRRYTIFNEAAVLFFFSFFYEKVYVSGFNAFLAFLLRYKNHSGTEV